MAFNGSGIFSRLYNFVTDRNNGIKVRADRMDAELDGLAAGLSNTICRDGQSTITADIPFNNKKITGLADATGATHALNRQSADARYVLNPDDLDQETTLADADEFPFYDASADANRSSTYANLRAKLGFASGTKGLFVQSFAPTGWTKDTTHNNKALRVVSGSASSGGATPFTDVFGARTIAKANLPSYNLTHTLAIQGAQSGMAYNIENSASGSPYGSPAANRDKTWSTTNLSIAGSIALGGSGTAMDFAVQYVDVIIATKD